MMDDFDIDNLEDWWVEKSRVNFNAYRQFMRHGNFLHGWFIESMALAFQRFYTDLKDGKRPILIVTCPPQHGKLMADNTPVLTTDGWKAHGDLAVGDSVFHPDGKTIKVTHVHPKSFADHEVVLDNGEVFYCHGNHEWNVFDRRKRYVKTLETKVMRNNGVHTGVMGSRGSRLMYKMPLISPIEGRHKKLPLHPYVLGAWLGDGTQTKPAITYDKKDIAIINRIERCGYLANNTYEHKDTGVKTSTFYFSGMRAGLKKAGVFTKEYGVRKKHIPDSYLNASVEQRLDLLAGLIDTDGYVYYKNGRTVFTTADKLLAEGVISLVSTFGWRSSVAIEQPKNSSSGIQGVNEYYVVGFNPTLKIPCELERKRVFKKPTRRMIGIRSINIVKKRQGNCITVDSKDGLYLVGKTLQPTHNSWCVEDFASWIAGLDPDIRMVYASFSEYLGTRCNAGLQRAMTADKYHKIFPETNINSKSIVTVSNEYRKNSTQVEFINKGGSFRNTTVGGPISGEALDVGFIDDPLKGRKEANSKLMRDTVWNWFLDDFGTRFSDKAGYIITMTRWHTDDIVGRLIEKYKDDPGRLSVFKYSAIAEQDEPHRKADDPLFPELKSLEFLNEKKSLMMNSSWQSLYQGNPVVEGGELIDKRWYKWWEALPQLKYTYAVADTAQKKNNWNDYTVFQLWGMGVDGCIYLLDMLHDKITAPELRRHGEIFYRKHDHNRYGGPFRGFCIEDKSSGIGLIQEFEEKKFKVYGIPRNTDKIERSMNVGPEIRAGKVFLNAAIPHVEIILEQTEQFPNGTFDDAWDTVMSGVEVAYIYPEILNRQIFVS